MKLGFFLSIGTLGCLPFGFSSPEALAASSDIFLSEVSIAGTATNDEFIELQNVNDTAFDLSGMQLRRRTTSGSESSIKVFAKDSIIPGHGFFLWANSQGIFKIPFADTETSSSALASDNSIGLFTKSGGDGVLIDSLAWGTGALFSPATPISPNPTPKKSLIHSSVTREWSLTENMTPTNSKGETFTDLPLVPVPLPPSDQAPIPIPSSVNVRFNELLPNPADDETPGEFIELWNEDSSSADLSGFTIHDASKSGAYTFPKDTRIAGQSYLVLTHDISKISLNNSDETLVLFDTRNSPLDSVHYDATKEGVSLNYTPAGWRGGTPTPGLPNDLNTLPETRKKVPREGYRGVPIIFDAHGRDADGDMIKYTWDFGDGHKSYKDTTTHTYEKKGSYPVILTTTDGSDDIIETFTLRIQPLPKPDVHIVAMLPNPNGTDTDHEWILIENRGKKPIDLKGFGIATGWKKLSNHPIRESFIIKPGKEATLTREFSLFTLPNQKGKIELRTPDGKVLQKIKYTLAKTVAEDMVYKKEKGKSWEWHSGTLSETTNYPVTNLAPAPVPSEQIPEQAIAPSEGIPVPPAQATPEIEPTPPDVEQTSPEETVVKEVLGAETTTPDGPPDKTQPNTIPHTPSFFGFFKNFFVDMNARLNAWQNKE